MRILILSYHFPPFNVVASYRAKAYADYLPKYGFDTTVLTHPWQEQEDHLKLEEESWGEAKIIRLPRRFSRLAMTGRRLLSLRGIRSLFNYLAMFMGFLDGNNIHVNYYYLYRGFLRKHLKSNAYDLVLPIFSPYNHLQLAFWIKRNFGIPFVPDFRDLYDNRILNDGYQPSLHARILNTFRRRYLRRWLSESEFVISTSTAWADHLGSLADKEGFEVLNGYEAEYLEGFRNPQKVSKFTVSSIGTMHDSQDWSSYLAVLQDFEGDHESVKFNFIGIGDRWRDRLTAWSQELTEKNVLLVGRVPKSEVAGYFKQSCVLLFPALEGNEGMYSAKIWEYLASQVPILYYPDDNSVVAQVIKTHQAGYVCKSKEELLLALQDLYKKWEENGFVISGMIWEDLEGYSRERQVAQLAGRLDSSINLRCSSKTMLNQQSEYE